HIMSYISLYQFLNNPEKLNIGRRDNSGLKRGALEIDFKT
ncbi:hypothetical protein SAMN05421827_1111, partial [Pedobacter terrae]